MDYELTKDTEGIAGERWRQFCRAEIAPAAALDESPGEKRPNAG